MNILLRNISSNVIIKLDAIAKERGVSREALLSEEINRFASREDIDRLEENYTKMCRVLADAIDKHTAMMSSFLEEAILDEEDAYFLHREIKKLEEIENKIPDDTTIKKNLSIKNIPETIVKTIDEYAEKRGVSRNEFIIRYLRQLTYSSNLKMIDDKFGYLIEKSLGILEYSNRVFDLFYEENVIE